ncbi:MAG: hypothetical protein HY553_09235, partial [Elusimicrobia bacterium]|nr:hypothetical protein [Elusimicrobiota bacterium]
AAAPRVGAAAPRVGAAAPRVGAAAPRVVVAAPRVVVAAPAPRAAPSATAAPAWVERVLSRLPPGDGLQVPPAAAVALAAVPEVPVPREAARTQKLVPLKSFMEFSFAPFSSRRDGRTQQGGARP